MNEERESSLDDELQSTKTLIYAVNLLSRNLPLPPHLFNAVSSIYAAGSDGDTSGRSDAAAIDSLEVLILVFYCFVLSFLFFFVNLGEFVL